MTRLNKVEQKLVSQLDGNYANHNHIPLAIIKQDLLDKQGEQGKWAEETQRLKFIAFLEGLIEYREKKDE